MRILLANPRGFCAGVERALEIVNQALENYGAPIYIRHELVHNRFVVEGLRARGAIFVEELRDVPDGATVIFSAHGVPQAVRDAAAGRPLRVLDATCPLVTKVHREVARHARAGRDVVLIGHAGHPEVIGTLGSYDHSLGGEIHLVENAADVARLKIRDPERIAFATQTTLSVDDTAVVLAALRERFPALVGPKTKDICYATQNRQDAVRALSRECAVILVVGSPSSSNSRRLYELAQKLGATAYLIDSAADLQQEWFSDCTNVGVTAGASAPAILVDEVVARLQEFAGGRTASEEKLQIFPNPPYYVTL